MEPRPLPVVEANRLRVKQLETKAIKQVEDVTKTQNWVFPKIEVPQNGWFIMEIPIKMDDLGVPLFSETPNCWRFHQQKLWVFVLYLFVSRFLLAPAKQGLSSNQNKSHLGFQA